MKRTINYKLYNKLIRFWTHFARYFWPEPRPTAVHSAAGFRIRFHNISWERGGKKKLIFLQRFPVKTCQRQWHNRATWGACWSQSLNGHLLTMYLTKIRKYFDRDRYALKRIALSPPWTPWPSPRAPAPASTSTHIFLTFQHVPVKITGQTCEKSMKNLANQLKANQQISAFK